MAIVEVRGLEQTFADVKAVDGLSFQIDKGQVLGFIGANGAGKTTTMRIMVTLDLPTSGSVRLCGFDAVDHPGEVRSRVGWMPDSYGSYPHTTVWEYLDFFGRAFGITGKERTLAVGDVMAFTDLASLRERTIDALSKGMKQRLCLARALLHDPEILILDEPAAGLDPKARVEFKRLVRLMADDGKTIFISSHILSELEEMCDQMLFIDAGQTIHHGSTESLKQVAGERPIFSVQLAEGVERLAAWAELSPGLEFVETMKGGGRIRLDSSDGDLAATVLARLVADGFRVVEFRREEIRLEQAFIETLERVSVGNGNGEVRIVDR